MRSNGQIKVRGDPASYSSFLFNKNNTNDHCIVEKEETMEIVRILAFTLIISSFFFVPFAAYFHFNLVIEYTDKWIKNGIAETPNHHKDRTYYLRGVMVAAIGFVEYECWVVWATVHINLAKDSIFTDIWLYNIIAFIILFIAIPLNYGVISCHRNQHADLHLCKSMKIGCAGVMFLIQMLAVNTFYFLLAVSINSMGSIFIFLNYISLGFLFTVLFSLLFESFDKKTLKFKNLVMAIFFIFQNIGICYVAFNLEMSFEFIIGVGASLQLAITFGSLVRLLDLDYTGIMRRLWQTCSSKKPRAKKNTKE